MNEPIKSYRDLIAWQKAFGLGLTLHALVARLPEHERYGLTAQLRRSAIDIASTIACGYGSGNTQDYLWFLKAARGGLYKIDTQLLFALEFEYLVRGRVPEDEIAVGRSRARAGGADSEPRRMSLGALMPRATMPFFQSIPVRCMETQP